MPKTQRKTKKQRKKSPRGKGAKPVRIQVGTLPVLAAVSAVAFTAIILFFVLHQQTSAGEKKSPDFYRMRETLNANLRDTLSSMGIYNKPRPVMESRDKMMDDSYSWYILNWKIPVDQGFDFSFAKGQLEKAIYESSGEFETYLNLGDSAIPLKLEAYVNKRLSHRVFFTTAQEQPRAKPVSTRPEAVKSTRPSAVPSLENRWQLLSQRQKSLDRQLQKVLLEAELQAPPLLLFERWDSADFPTWVVNSSKKIDLFEISQLLRDNITVPGFWFEENFEIETASGFAIDAYVDDQLSHRLLFSRNSTAKGLELLRKKGEPAVYLSKPKVAIIIDDIGIDIAIAEKIMRLPEPVTLSILPHLSRSHEIAIRAFQHNHEFMLHLPMEPGNASISPGAGGIYVDQDAATKRRITLENIEAIPNVTGVNNHMGSRATSDPETVGVILQTVAGKGLFFIDSRTAASTVAYQKAREMGIPTAERQVFLDTSAGPDYQFSLKQLRLLAAKARMQGACVAIGHPFEETIRAITDMIPEMKRQGIEFVFASQIVSN